MEHESRTTTAGPDRPTDGGAPADAPAPATPAAPTVVRFPRRPFDRAAHCQAIAAGGGLRTVALYGTQTERIIGKAGAQATTAKHGYWHWLGIVRGKGWAGPQRPDLTTDLALGEYLADAA